MRWTAPFFAVAMGVVGWGCRSAVWVDEGRVQRMDKVAAEEEPRPPAAAARLAALSPERSRAACPGVSDPGVGILVNPSRLVAGRPFLVMAATLDDETPLRVSVEPRPAEDVQEVVRAGVPSATYVRFDEAPAGGVTVRVERGGKAIACRAFTVATTERESVPPLTTDSGVWKVERAWNAAEEAMYSAWVRELFHADRGEELAWKALHEATSRRSRNLLHGALGWDEDDPDTSRGLYLKPDCADTPYFLRAYYAWKRRLPFGFRRCTRGRDGAPTCGKLRGISGPPEDLPAMEEPRELQTVQKYFRRTLAWGVHSGNGRTALTDGRTDFYPVELTRRAIRPGTIYADPYGHIFVVVEWFASEGGRPGVLYAIDGQPDGSITRKRFWEGNFLWNPDPSLGGSGFKAFRPHVAKSASKIAAVADAELEQDPIAGRDVVTQAQLTAPEFYDRMEALITPGVRDPFAAQEEAVVALYEAAKVRVTSVQNAEDYLRGNGGVIEMPDGHAIFETTGAWENYSTPARDLRLLIAIDVARGFADKVARNPGAFDSGGRSPAELRKAMADARRALIEDPRFEFSYTRTNGTQWTLGLADVLERAASFQLGYNPNDCPEVRWGAPAGSAERRTCRRRAPDEQQRKMRTYQVWFRKRQRPQRGDPGPSVE